MHLKDAIPDMEKFGVVHVLECKASYVGESKRKLCKKLKGHKRAVRVAILMHQQLVAEHVWSAGHAVDWNWATVLDQQQHLHSRLTLESYHIRKQPRVPFIMPMITC